MNLNVRLTPRRPPPNPPNCYHPHRSVQTCPPSSRDSKFCICAPDSMFIHLTARFLEDQMGKDSEKENGNEESSWM